MRYRALALDGDSFLGVVGEQAPVVAKVPVCGAEVRMAPERDYGGRSRLVEGYSDYTYWSPAY